MFTLHHVSYVTCEVPCVTFYFIFYFFGQSGGAMWWRVCYQQGLPHLVLMSIQVCSSLAGYKQHNECLDTHHTYSLMQTTRYNLLYTVLYTVVYNRQHLEVQLAALKDLFPQTTYLSASCKLYLAL